MQIPLRSTAGRLRRS